MQKNFTSEACIYLCIIYLLLPVPYLAANLQIYADSSWCILILNLTQDVLGRAALYIIPAI